MPHYKVDLIRIDDHEDVEMDKTTEEFLTELSALSQRTGITVHGCGCCGSPFLELKNRPDVEGHYLTWKE